MNDRVDKSTNLRFEKQSSILELDKLKKFSEVSTIHHGTLNGIFQVKQNNNLVLKLSLMLVPQCAVGILQLEHSGLMFYQSDSMGLLHGCLMKWLRIYFISFDVIFICLLSGNNVSLVRCCEREVMQRFHSSLHGTFTYETSNHNHDLW